MPETEFSNREISLMFEELKVILESVKHTGEETGRQAKSTNGRVTELEKRESSRTGALRVIVYIALPLFGVLVAYLAWLGVQVNSIPKVVEDTIKVLEIKVVDDTE